MQLKYLFTAIVFIAVTVQGSFYAFPVVLPDLKTRFGYDQTQVRMRCLCCVDSQFSFRNVTTQYTIVRLQTNILGACLYIGCMLVAMPLAPFLQRTIGTLFLDWMQPC